MKPNEPVKPVSLTIGLVTLAVILAWLLHLPNDASARNTKPRKHWTRATSSYYGPGLYGNRTACGQTLTRRTIGVANKTMPCGTRVRLAYHGRRINARVIDRGPYVYGRTFDLTTRTARALCRCRSWGVRSHRYRILRR